MKQLRASCQLPAAPPPRKHSLKNEVRDFANEVVGKPVFLVCNSVGGVAGLQTGVDAPNEVGMTM